MTEPQISVVIPTHGGRFLPTTIASVQAQTLADWELVIVDDASTDGTAGLTAALGAQDPRIRVVTNLRKAGIAGARNRGLASIARSSRYVALLDHDDLLMPDALALLLEALRARPAATAAHGRAIEIDEHGAPIPVDPIHPPWPRLGIDGARLVAWPPDRPTEFANLAYEDCIPSVGSGLIRRSEIEAIGGLDPRAEPADDYDLWIRLARRAAIAYVDRVVLAYRVHGERTSVRAQPPRGQGVPYVRYKMIMSPDNTPAQRRVAVAGYRARQRRMMRACWSELIDACQRHEYRRVPSHTFHFAARLASHARGRPWAWHR
jgi:glycosyltransferase involved in cell wall biosynthesis